MPWTGGAARAAAKVGDEVVQVAGRVEEGGGIAEREPILPEAVNPAQYASSIATLLPAATYDPTAS